MRIERVVVNASPSLQALSDAGLWLSPGVIQSVLNKAGEA